MVQQELAAVGNSPMAQFNTMCSPAHDHNIQRYRFLHIIEALCILWLINYTDLFARNLRHPLRRSAYPTLVKLILAAATFGDAYLGSHNSLQGRIIAGLLTLCAVQFQLQLLGIWLDPSKAVPGPFLARFTRWYIVVRLSWCKSEAEVFSALHYKYGPLVRVAPNLYNISDRKLYGFLKTTIFSHHRFTLSTQPFLSFHQAMSLIMSASAGSTVALLEDAVDHCLGKLQAKLAQHATDGEGFDVFDVARCLSIDSTTAFVMGGDYDFVSAAGYKPASNSLLQAEFMAILSGLNVRSEPAQLLQLHSLASQPDLNAYLGEVTDNTTRSMYNLLERAFGTENKLDDWATIVREPCTIINDTWRKCLLDQAFSGNKANNPDTAKVVTTALYFLAHPRAGCSFFLEDVRNELLRARKNNKVSDPPSMAELSKLPYFQALLKECVRWISLGVQKFESTENVWPMGKEAYSCETYLSEGARFSLSPGQWSGIKDIWGKDPLSFRPQRFVVASDKDLRLRNKLMLPFGFDHQGMPGQCLALIEASKILFHLVDTYDFEYPGLVANFDKQFAMQKVNKLWMTLKPKGSGMKWKAVPAPTVRVPTNQTTKETPAPAGLVQKIGKLVPLLSTLGQKQQPELEPTIAEPKPASTPSHQRSESASSSRPTEANNSSAVSGSVTGRVSQPSTKGTSLPVTANDSVGTVPSPPGKDAIQAGIDAYNANASVNKNNNHRRTGFGNQHRGGGGCGRGGRNQRPRGQGQGQGRTYADRNRPIQPRPQPTGPGIDGGVTGGWANFAANAHLFDEAMARANVERAKAMHGEPKGKIEVTYVQRKKGAQDE